MPRTTGKDVAKAIQKDLGLETQPTGQEVASAMYGVASPNFQSTIGDPNEVSSLEFMNGLLEYPDTLGVEFMNLATRIGRVIAHKNILTNKLAPFKMENMALGYTMEEYLLSVQKSMLTIKPMRKTLYLSVSCLILKQHFMLLTVSHITQQQLPMMICVSIL